MAECGQRNIVKIAGVVGHTHQAVKEAELAAELGYDIALVSLGDLPGAGIPELLDHIRAVARILPVMGFYLQPAVSGRPLPYEFWRAWLSSRSHSDQGRSLQIRYHTLNVMAVYWTPAVRAKYSPLRQ